MNSAPPATNFTNAKLTIPHKTQVKTPIQNISHKTWPRKNYTAQIIAIKVFTMTEQPIKTEKTDFLYFVRPQALLSQLVWEAWEFNIILLAIRPKPMFNDDESRDSEHNPAISFSAATALLPASSLPEQLAGVKSSAAGSWWTAVVIEN